MHPSSLPGSHGIGDLGAASRDFVDWLARAGASVWQVLPLVPVGAGDSPYSSAAALAGNPWLIDLQALVLDGLLEAVPPPPRFPVDRIDVAAMTAYKLPLIASAAARLVAGHPLYSALQAFIAAQGWVKDVALYFALKQASGNKPWWEWPAALRDRDPAALSEARAEHAAAYHRVLCEQFLFERQWQALRGYARQRGVSLYGDVPIYVDWDSADVWVHRAQFQLDAEGAPLEVAGVPPDYFSATGQLWGNPLYEWAAMAKDHHAWWVARLQRVLSQVDIVRIDHFRAFAAYWAVPRGSLDARPGKWRQGPGEALFDDLKKALGELPIVAEDLGVIDDAVRALVRGVGLPGMKVLQFAFGEDAKNPFLPHNYAPDCVAYTGTHDNDTTRGWWQSSDEQTRDHVRRYLGVDGHDVVWDLMRAALASVANTVIVPLQDILELGAAARMNVPAAPTGNWLWRVHADAFLDDRSHRFRTLVSLYGRTAP